MKEADIRPKELFDRYLALCRSDIERFFGDDSGFESVSCPACASDRLGTDGFTKLGFRYEECADCHSLYVTPRPSAATQAAFARDSEASRFWSTHFYRETAEARREKIFRPRAELVRQLVTEGEVPRTDTFADVGAGYGMFLEEVSSLGVFERVIGIEPDPGLAGVCREKGFPIVESMMEDLQPGEVNAGLLTAFEVLEHVFDPQAFVAACGAALHDDGVLLFTTLTISGFDLQVLWNKSNSIYPPQHINMMSIDGLSALVSRSGLEVISITTPGKLDVDIVGNALRDDPSLSVPRFARSLVSSSADVRADFQSFLQRAKLSSHVRILARKRRAA